MADNLPSCQDQTLLSDSNHQQSLRLASSSTIEDRWSNRPTEAGRVENQERKLPSKRRKALFRKDQDATLCLLKNSLRHWSDIAGKFNRQHGMNLTIRALQLRYKNIRDSSNKSKIPAVNEDAALSKVMYDAVKKIRQGLKGVNDASQLIIKHSALPKDVSEWTHLLWAQAREAECSRAEAWYSRYIAACFSLIYKSEMKERNFRRMAVLAQMVNSIVVDLLPKWGCKAKLLYSAFAVEGYYFTTTTDFDEDKCLQVTKGIVKLLEDDGTEAIEECPSIHFFDPVLLLSSILCEKYSAIASRLGLGDLPVEHVESFRHMTVKTRRISGHAFQEPGDGSLSSAPRPAVGQTLPNASDLTRVAHNNELTLNQQLPTDSVQQILQTTPNHQGSAVITRGGANTDVSGSQSSSCVHLATTQWHGQLDPLGQGAGQTLCYIFGHDENAPGVSTPLAGQEVPSLACYEEAAPSYPYRDLVEVHHGSTRKEGPADARNVLGDTQNGSPGPAQQISPSVDQASIIVRLGKSNMDTTSSPDGVNPVNEEDSNLQLTNFCSIDATSFSNGWSSRNNHSADCAPFNNTSYDNVWLDINTPPVNFTPSGSESFSDAQSGADCAPFNSTSYNSVWPDSNTPPVDFTPIGSESFSDAQPSHNVPRTDCAPFNGTSYNRVWLDSKTPPVDFTPIGSESFSDAQSSHNIQRADCTPFNRASCDSVWPNNDTPPVNFTPIGSESFSTQSHHVRC